MILGSSLGGLVRESGNVHHHAKLWMNRLPCLQLRLKYRNPSKPVSNQYNSLHLQDPRVSADCADRVRFQS